MKQNIFNIVISLLVCSLGIMQYLDYFSNKEGPITDIIEETSEEPLFLSQSPKEGLMEALDYYGVKHPEIVYAQAVLETGHFKSDLCLNGNNLFGLYNSRKKEYYRFDHWTESVEAYIDFIQYRHKPPNDYYKFLDNIGYAEDPHYINKLKRIVNRNDKRRTSDSVTVTNKAK